jgi:hypothetical protein
MVSISLASEEFGEFYSYSALKISSILDRWPVKLNIPVPKIEFLQMGPETQNEDFLENCSNDFDSVQQFMKTTFLS